MATADEWTLEKEKLLISLFERCEPLWMRSHSQYRSAKAKKSAMHAISLRLGIEQKKILLKLKEIKNHLYTFSRTGRVANQGQGLPFKSGYHLFDECNFFLKEIQIRTTRRYIKKQLLLEGRTPSQVASVLSSELNTGVPISEDGLFSIIMQSYYSIGARKEYEFDWTAVVKAIGFNNPKHSQHIEPEKAKETWSNMSLGIIKACEKLCPESADSNLDVWKALEKLAKVPNEEIPEENAWITSLVNLFSSTSPRFCEYDNELLFDLIEKQPILKQIFQKCKKNLRIMAWEVVTNEYNVIKHLKVDKFRLKKHWFTLLRTIERRMIIFMKSVNEAPDNGNICAPTDFEKRIIERNPKLLILSKSRDFSIIPYLDKYTTEKESNERASDQPDVENSTPDLQYPVIAEVRSELNLADKKTVKEAGVVLKNSSKLEIIDIHTGDEEHANVYEVNEGFIDDLEINHILHGLRYSKGQLSDADASFLLVKWLSADAKERNIDLIPVSAFTTKDNPWDTLAKKFQPYSPQDPKELFKKWKNIFFHALCNIERNTRTHHSDMTDLDWMVLQSFPSMFIKSTRNRKLNEDNTSAPASALLPETLVCESSEQSPVVSVATSTLASDDNTRLPGYREGTDLAQMKEPIDDNSDIPNNDLLSLDQSLPELKRHQKPIILSDKTEVFKMNQQLQTAAISPNCSKSKDNRSKRGEKLTLLKKCEKGQVMDVQLTWGQKKKETIEKRYLSYRPNPKFYRHTASWMIKPKVAEAGEPVAATNKPVVKFVDKNEAYQDFLNILEKFSQSEPKPACTVYTPPKIQESDQKLTEDTPITEGIDNTLETVDLFSDSNCDSDGSILNFAALRQIAAEKTKVKAKRPVKRRRIRGISIPRVNDNFDNFTSIHVPKEKLPYNRRVPKTPLEQNSLPETDHIDQSLLVPIRAKRIFTILPKKRGRPPKEKFPQNVLPMNSSLQDFKPMRSSSEDGEMSGPNKSHSESGSKFLISSSEEDGPSDWSAHYKNAVRRKMFRKNPRSEKVNILNMTQEESMDKEIPSEVMNLVITAPTLDKPITMEVNITPSANDIGGSALLSNPGLLTGMDVESGELLSFIPITYKRLYPIMKKHKRSHPDLVFSKDPLEEKTIMDSQKETYMDHADSQNEISTSMYHVDSQNETATSMDLVDSQNDTTMSMDHIDSQKTKAASYVDSQQETAEHSTTTTTTTTSLVPQEDTNTPTDSSKIDLRSYYSMMADSLDFSNLGDSDFDFGDLVDGEILDSENSTVVPVSINEAEHVLDADEDLSYILPEPADSIQAVKRLHEATITLSDSEDEIPLARFTKRSIN